MRSFFLLVLVVFLGDLHAAERPAKPNVVLILADDLGWQDVKCYDIDDPSPMETPNLDALANKGVQVLARPTPPRPPARPRAAPS